MRTLLQILVLTLGHYFIWPISSIAFRLLVCRIKCSPLLGKLVSSVGLINQSWPAIGSLLQHRLFLYVIYVCMYVYVCVCVCVCIYIYIYTGCNRRKGQNFGRVFLVLKYTDVTQNTYVQSWTVTEIMAREVWNFDSCYTLIDCQIHIKTGRNMWFL